MLNVIQEPLELRRPNHDLASRFFAGFLLLCALLHRPEFAQADGTVSDCTQAALVAALAEGGNITFGSDCTISLADSIVITNDVVLDSVGQTVTITSDTNNQVPLFVVASNASLTLVGITLTGGQSTNGGALYIHAGATVVLTDCILSDNHAVGTNGIAGADGSDSASGNGGNGRNGSAGSAAFGGAIYNLGDLTLESCTLTNNNATGGTGGKGGNGGHGGGSLATGGNGGNGGNAGSAAGGAIYNRGILSVTDSTISSNTVTGGNGGAGGTNGTGFTPGLAGTGGAGGAASGAGIYSIETAEDVMVFNCTFSDNIAEAGNSSAAGTSSVGDGVSGARGPDSLGGGLYIAQGGITNCTFFNNKITAGNGGNGGVATRTLGIGGSGGNGGNGYGGGLYGTGVVDVVNCTFSSCAAIGGTNGVGGAGFTPGSNGSPGKGRGGDIANAAGTFTLINSIVTTNLAGGNFTNISGTFVNGGHNISSDNTFHFTGTSVNNTDPRIGPLADNGGPTETMKLLANSPAIDKGDDNAAPDVDQRGVARPIGVHVDIGAYESELGVEAAPPTFSIGGQVFNGTNGLAGVTVKADTNSAVTTSNGTYTITGVRVGTYFVFASLAGYKFSPAVSVTVGPNATNINFFVSNIVFSISGHVLVGTNGLSGVTFQEFGSITTDSTGAFAIPDLVPDTYTLTPRKISSTYGFVPKSRTVVLTNQDVTKVDFEAGTLITSFAILSNGTVQLAVTGPVKTNRIDASSNLVDWVSIFTNRTVPFQFSDTQASNFPIRFYRVVQLP